MTRTKERRAFDRNLISWTDQVTTPIVFEVSKREWSSQMRVTWTVNKVVSVQFNSKYYQKKIENNELGKQNQQTKHRKNVRRQALTLSRGKCLTPTFLVIQFLICQLYSCSMVMDSLEWPMDYRVSDDLQLVLLTLQICFSLVGLCFLTIHI